MSFSSIRLSNHSPLILPSIYHSIPFPSFFTSHPSHPTVRTKNRAKPLPSSPSSKRNTEEKCSRNSTFPSNAIHHPLLLRKSAIIIIPFFHRATIPPPLTRFNNKSTIYPHFSSYYLFFRSSTTIISPEFVIGKRTTGTTGRKREKRERERQRDEGTNIICPGSFVGFVAGTAANKKRILFVLAASLHKVSPSLVHRNKL